MTERLQNIINRINDGSIKDAKDLNLTKEDLFTKDDNGSYFLEYLLRKKIMIPLELKEELNYDIRQEELKIVRIVENFFTYKDGRVFHEYLFIYELTIDDSIYNGDFKNLENENITMNWMKEEAFILYNVKPGLCKGIIADNSLKHIILNEKAND